MSDALHLLVGDDGLGFDAEAVQQAGISVGGQLEVLSAGQGMPGEGTTLLVQLPVAERCDSVPAAL